MSARGVFFKGLVLAAAFGVVGEPLVFAQAAKAASAQIEAVPFEGAEKKLEVVVDPSVGNLREKPKEFWERVVRRSGAKILSEACSNTCSAYLLSESSLFVFSDRFAMITCGRTQLAQAVVETITEIPPHKIARISYERKNEFYPWLQPTDFNDDIKVLQGILPGDTIKLGNEGDHYIQFFQTPGRPTISDKPRFEILSYDFQSVAARSLAEPGLSSSEILRFLGLKHWFPNFVWDDFAFSPAGYSVNGIGKDGYVTVHITPELTGSFVSFETNVDMGRGWKAFVNYWTGKFQPRSFDLVEFSSSAGPMRIRPLDYTQTQNLTRRLNERQYVKYATFQGLEVFAGRDVK